MLSLQVFVHDQTFLKPLGAGRFVIGSKPGSDLRLEADGVEPVHARIEPVGTGYKIIDLETRSGTRVNGNLIAQVRLELGDRIEIGPAIILVGDQVIREATPKEVLADTTPPRASAPSGDRPAAIRGVRRASLTGRSVPASRLGIAAVVSALFVACAFFFFGRGAAPEPDPARLTEALRLSWQGRHEDAEAHLLELERSWAPPRASRLQRLADARAEAQEARAAFVRVDSVIEELADSAPRKALEERLRSMTDSGEVALAKAARNRLARLEDLLLARSGKTGLEPRPEDIASIPPDQKVEQPVDLSDVFRRVGELTTAGRFGAAQDLLRQAMLEGGVAAAARLRDELLQVQAQAKVRIDKVSEQAKRLEESGDLLGALGLLDAEKVHFPDVGPLALLSHEAKRIGLRLSGRAPPVSGPLARVLPAGAEGAEWGDLARTAAQMERELRFDEARALYLAALEKVKRDDLDLARDLEAWAGDVDDMQRTYAVLSTAAAAEPERFRKILSAGGVVVWTSGSLDALIEHLPRTSHSPREWLGLAVLAFRSGQKEQGERMLRTAFQKDPRLSVSIQDILARSRREEVPPGGYVLDGERWVASTERDDRLKSEELGRKLVDVLRVRDEAGRSAAFDKLLLERSTRAEPVIMALAANRAKVVASLQKAGSGSLKDGLDKLAALRAELDSRRQAAITLIFDEVKYFYPFKPPEVSGERAAAYREVQKEVDRLVGAVREVWNDSKTSVRVPSATRTSARDLAWIDARLGELGETPERDESLGWALALPEDDVITVRCYCATAEELGALVAVRDVLEFNARVAGQMTVGEREQLAVTNEYRLMMGRQPVAASLKILEAARGHCEEMERLGYFSHFSPTPGRRTPFDRMRLAGYEKGVGENLAINGSALGAHESWLHSSGHHRNILMAHCREFACGNRGNYWCQNFGTGKEYVDDPGFGVGRVGGRRVGGGRGGVGVGGGRRGR